jgi:hypothetical protein
MPTAIQSLVLLSNYLVKELASTASLSSRPSPRLPCSRNKLEVVSGKHTVSVLVKRRVVFAVQQAAVMVAEPAVTPSS